MRNTWLINLALLAIIGVLALLLIFKPGKEQEEAGHPLMSLTPDTVTRIRLERSHQPTMLLEKQGDDWRMLEPIQARSNTFNVNGLLQIASLKSDLQLPVVENELNKYGLASPQITLWLNDQPVYLGSRHPLNNARYLRHQDQVHVVQAYHLYTIDSPYTDFIDTRLLEAGRALHILQLPRATLTLKDGVWHKTPEDEALTTDRINSYVAEWLNARALSVDKYSGKKVQQTIRLTFAGTEDGKSLELNLGILAYQPEFILYRKDEGLEYRFPEEIGNRLMELKAGDH